MNDYYSVKFTIEPPSEDVADLLASDLADAGYESFVASETEPGREMTAYVSAEQFAEEVLREAVANVPIESEISYSVEFVAGRDWNEEWEKNYFKPILIEGKVAVHSSFHSDVPVAEYDIVIDPKMAFGTGHHATTTLMLKSILSMDEKGLKVVDAGTGTGILAILAMKRGAAQAIAYDIDGFALENTKENLCLNLSDEEMSRTTLSLGGSEVLRDIKDFDLVLANINRNIITADLPAFSSVLKTGGRVVVSGFYVEDRLVVESAAKACGLVLESVDEKDNWTSMTFVKP